jgi:hypothetical protein
LPRGGKNLATKHWSGDIHACHLWWFSHAPTETDGISNNWWEYAFDPNKV